MTVELRARTVNPSTQPGLIVTAEWPEPDADIDLHLIAGGARIFDVPADLTGCATVAPASAGRLMVATASAGPALERAEIDADILVRHRAVVSVRGEGPATATVRFWAFGRFLGTARRRIPPGSIWVVGDVLNEVAWADTPLQPEPFGGRCF